MLVFWVCLSYKCTGSGYSFVRRCCVCGNKNNLLVVRNCSELIGACKWNVYFHFISVKISMWKSGVFHKAAFFGQFLLYFLCIISDIDSTSVMKEHLHSVCSVQAFPMSQICYFTSKILQNPKRVLHFMSVFVLNFTLNRLYKQKKNPRFSMRSQITFGHFGPTVGLYMY